MTSTATRFIVFVAAATLTACGGGSDGSGPTGNPSPGGTGGGNPPPVQVPATVTPLTGSSYAGIVGSTQSVRVAVTTSTGAAVPNFVVTFAVTAGAGTVSPNSVTTDASGQAAAQWTLGTRAGQNSLTATAGNVAPLVLVASASAGPAASLTPLTAASQSANMGAAVPVAPAVLVADSYQNPVAGVAVTFSNATGGGSVISASQVTDQNGRAAVGSWVLGYGATSQTLSAASGSLPPVTFSAAAANPWAISTSSSIILASRQADEGSMFGQAPNWAATVLGSAPLLGISCGSGTMIISVYHPRLITYNGTVTYQFDDGPRFSDTWRELSPDFDMLYTAASNATTRSFALQMAGARNFNISFRQYPGTALFAPNFDMRGLSLVLPQVLSACNLSPRSTSPTAPEADLRAAWRSRAPTR